MTRAAVACLVAFACASPRAVDWTPLAIADAVDQDPAPDVVEVELVAKSAELEIIAGKRTSTWTYNGQTPGPTIRARPGDRVLVHFRNELPVATTIHWHGVRLPNAMDGVPDVTQPAVQPGESFDYDFVVPDAGTFWYHPHVDSSVQVDSGLYGALVVSDGTTFGDEGLLVLSDVSLDETGARLPDGVGALHDLFGREGSHVLTNGRIAPRLVVPNGRRLHLRLVNAARARYFHLQLTGHTFVVIGGDAGLQAEAEERDRVLIAPGERVELLVTMTGDAGTSLELWALPFDRFTNASFGKSNVRLVSFELAGPPAAPPAPLPSPLREIAPMIGGSARTIVLGQSGNQLLLDGFAPPAMPMYDATIGDAGVWIFDNQTDWDHPMHLHGFFFQPLDEGGPLRLKDTINVPKRSKVRVAVRFDDRPGDWMLHCHILDHADHGMMGMVMLAP